ncbi:alpha/beta hydrolase [Streptomyces sp. NPDC087294]|uniref:alpha/beta hydrolase n=1 Tax=Streptomyces sp. NPDC087294 TaxID=3365777 RepID=UPI0038253AC1
MLATLSTRLTLRRSAIISAVGLTLLAAGLPATAADGAGPDLARFYRQQVAWSRCEGLDLPEDVQCGKVTVPLDYARPGAATLDLALARYRATGKKRGSVLLNFGGPGGAGVAELGVGGKDFMGLTNGYDVVSFDPRGVGRSSPVSCGDGRTGVTGTAGDGVGMDDPPAVLRQLRTLAEHCARHSGPVLPHIGTVNASRDLDVIRQALGDRKLNYLGFSYGTRLGAVYAAQFPKKVGRFVLDGVDTLTESMAEQGVAGAEGQQRALDDFVGWCARDIACPFGQDPREGRAQVVRLVRSLDEDPVPTGFGDDFTGQDLVGALGQALYSRRLWPSLERALASLVEDGDTSGVLRFASGGMAPAFRARDGGGLVDADDVPLDNLPAALMAINCADDPDRPDAARLTGELPGLRAEFDRASPVFGRSRLIEVLMCYGRPKGTDYIRDRVRAVDTPQMLLVGTRGDPATPYRWTVETARRLGPSAVVLDNRGEGHTGYSSSKCVHAKVDAFLLYGGLPPTGSSCGPEGGSGGGSGGG